MKLKLELLNNNKLNKLLTYASRQRAQKKIRSKSLKQQSDFFFNFYFLLVNGLIFFGLFVLFCQLFLFKVERNTSGCFTSTPPFPIITYMTWWWKLCLENMTTTHVLFNLMILERSWRKIAITKVIIYPSLLRTVPIYAY